MQYLASVCILIHGFFTLANSVQHDLPPYFPRCKRYDPKLNECLLNATEIVKPFLIKGVPELGIISVDPYFIDEITLEQGTSALNFKAKLKNIEVKGLSSYKFSQFNFDVPKLQWICKATIKEMVLVGDYIITGKILLAPIQGAGKFVASIENSNITAYKKVELGKRSGVDYFIPVHSNTSLDVGGPKVHFDGLFDGSKELNKVTNTVINDNINELFEDLKPVIEKVVTNILDKWIINVLDNNIPADKLYPIN